MYLDNGNNKNENAIVAKTKNKIILERKKNNNNLAYWLYKSKRLFELIRKSKTLELEITMRLLV